MLSHVRCLLCGNTSERREPFLDVSLGIPAPQQASEEDKSNGLEGEREEEAESSMGGVIAEDDDVPPVCRLEECLVGSAAAV